MLKTNFTGTKLVGQAQGSDIPIMDLGEWMIGGLTQLVVIQVQYIYLKLKYTNRIYNQLDRGDTEMLRNMSLLLTTGAY